ncbi:unnamed protein product [Meganyctiphanes norvegica]|uniref:Ankyrin repeat domain-containing protein n=1 Tax=Meganyctiphanes norvegica TaxID=48144 RepID=A0AAV2PN07_MEGNR
MGNVTVACVAVLVGAALATANFDLWDGAKDGDLPKVKEALAAGSDPNWQNPDVKWGYTALHWAAANNHPAIVTELLGAGADKNIKNNDGSTPLWIASSRGSTDVITLLVSHDANVNMEDNYGTTAIMEATSRGHLSAVETLIAADADLTLTYNYGNTPLHYAAWKNEVDIAQVLLQAGADKTIQNNLGKTPGDYARQNRNPQLGEIIDNYVKNKFILITKLFVKKINGNKNLNVAKNKIEIY